MTVYLLCLEPAYRHARHYIGFTPDADAARRVEEHLRGQGSPLIRAAVAGGGRALPAHQWPGAGRDFERSLKDRRDVGKWCPRCGTGLRPFPEPERITGRFRDKTRRFTAEATA